MKKIILILLSLNISIVYSQTTDRNQNTAFVVANTISVTIGGQFPLTGTFPASVTERVDQFVTRIYSQALERSLRTATDQVMLEKIKQELSDFSLRGILLKRSSGEEIILDLAKFRIDGDFRNNPYLKNDDVIIFPPNDMDRNFISITGAVNSPGKFLFVEGDKLKDVIELARGINQAYENVNKAKIYRLSYDGINHDVIEVDIKNDILLKRGDQVVILADETQRKEFFALVLGEVIQPGYVPVTRNSTKLGEVIKQVKGFTDNASLIRARLFRGNSVTALLEKQYSIKIDEKLLNNDRELIDRIVNYEQAMMFRMSNLVEEDQYYFQAENQYRVLNEGSAIDFTKISDENSEIYNFIVYPGDVIIIPPKRNTIYVFGQVSNPGHVKFVEGKDFLYYIEQAGGLGEYAEDEIMIIKGSSRNWIPAERNVQIEEGDYIFIPKKRIQSFRSFVMELSGYFSIVGSIATILLLIVQLGK
ncbi:SLBB domain-containing protein [Ignavibacterium album]|uniref:SLBB domain-containing protein n=1 Tax=Ignavibacterium album TaxID=591197 RepID=UPI0035B74BA6